MENSKPAQAAPSESTSGAAAPADLSLLQTWVNWFSWTMLAVGLFFFVLYFVIHSPASLVIAGVMTLVLFPMSLYGKRAASAGRYGPALLAISLSCWILVLVISARGSTALPVALPLLLLPVIFALPYVHRNVLLLIALLALLVCALAGGLTVLPPLLESRIDEHTLAIIIVPLLVISTGLAIFGLWYVGSALRTSLRETKSMNVQLANSERELERKVANRTRELQNAVSELSDIDSIARTVNVTLDFAQVISAMHSALQRVIHFDQLSILLLDDSGKRLMVDHVAGIDLSSENNRRLLEEGVPADEEGSVFTAVLQRVQPIVTGDISPDQVAAMSSVDRILYEANPVRSLLICPLEFAGKSIGVLLLGRNRETMSLSPEEVSRIQRYIAPLAIVIRNARFLEEAEAARAEAIESSKAKSRFLANMSHELRTPLNAIIGFCELLAEEAEEAGDDQYLDDLEKIRSSGRYLLELISGVLDLTRIDAGKADVEVTEFDVRNMVEDLVASTQPLAARENNQLAFAAEDGLGTMNSDLTKIRQILINLISNACKFTHDGDITVGARRVRRGNLDHVVFEVADTGIGISPEQRERIFEAFTQADESSSRRYGGTGLGLTISRQFCELLGGSLQLADRDGEGSTFIVDLPAQAPVANQPK